MARKKVIKSEGDEAAEVKKLYDEVLAAMEAFRAATLKLSELGFYTVAQKDNTLYIYRNIIVEQDGVTITKTVSIGKPYRGEPDAIDQEGKKDPIADA